ncbi:MAG TPA: DUF1993 domain-containing protein [Vitreimonas sp.]|nr:DUF1993 domain-containing protein [Vitreimonas sp.]
MTALNMYAVSAPVFVRMLNNLSAMLAKGEAHAKTKNFDCAALLNSRLAPDMFTLTKQVQIATDHAKGAMARLAGHQIEAIEDKETTVAELQARIKKVIGIVESYKEADLAGAENREITIKIPTTELKFDGLSYLEGWAMPNFYFHVTMAYAILRHNGVDLGKRDFLMS